MDMKGTPRPYIEVVEALHLMAGYGLISAAAVKQRYLASMEKWTASHPPYLLMGLEQVSGQPAPSPDQVNADVLAGAVRAAKWVIEKTGKPTESLIEELRADIQSEEDQQQRIDAAEQVLLDAALEERIKIYAIRSPHGEKPQGGMPEAIPKEYFLGGHVAVHVFSNMLTVDPLSEAFFGWDRPDWHELQVAVGEIEKLNVGQLASPAPAHPGKRSRPAVDKALGALNAIYGQTASRPLDTFAEIERKVQAKLDSIGLGKFSRESLEKAIKEKWPR